MTRFLALFLALSGICWAGEFDWLRDYNETVKRAKKSRKVVVMVFGTTPGGEEH